MENLKGKIDKKLLIIIGVILVVIVIALFVVFLVIKPGSKKEQNNNEETNNSIIDMNNKTNVTITEDNMKVNQSDKVKEIRKLDGIEIRGIELYATGDISYFKANVKNTNGSTFTASTAKITFKNKKGETTNILEVSIPEIAGNGEGMINASTTADIANAYDFTIELNK